jgi:hypothetical protein
MTIECRSFTREPKTWNCKLHSGRWKAAMQWHKNCIGSCKKVRRLVSMRKSPSYRTGVFHETLRVVCIWTIDSQAARLHFATLTILQQLSSTANGKSKYFDRRRRGSESGRRHPEQRRRPWVSVRTRVVSGLRRPRLGPVSAVSRHVPQTPRST